MTEQIAAPILALTLFAWLGVTGCAFLSVVGFKRHFRNLLVAPAFGMAIALLPTFWLSWIGIPVARFGPTCCAVLSGATVVALYWRPPPFNRRALAQVGAPIGAAFALTAWPLWTHG